MKRVDVQNVEARLRSEQPGEVRAPAWVRTRVIASMDGAQDARAWRFGSRARVAYGLSGLALAAVAVAALVMLPGTPGQTDLSPAEWRTDEPVRIAIPARMRVTIPDGPLAEEVRNIRADFVEIMGVVRVPMERINEASKQFAGSV